MSSKVGGTSSLIGDLYGDVTRYRELLKPAVMAVADSYQDEGLRELFLNLPNKVIALAPMAICDAFCFDLTGNPADDVALTALGLTMLPISTHDDVVDEMPRERDLVSRLIFSGNIMAIEGVRMLLKTENKKAADVLMQQINLNHLYQRKNILLLWENKATNFANYRKGIEHICIFNSIGAFYGCALANREDVLNKARDFSEGYGVAMQLIDDIREVEEDLEAGYSSFPLLENAPYKESFTQLFSHLDLAKRGADENWSRVQEIVARMKSYAEKLQKEFADFTAN